MGESSSGAARSRVPFTFTPGVLSDRVTARLGDAERAIAGLYRLAPDTWSTDPDVVKKIEQRLGWLYLPRTMRDALPQVMRFAEGVRRDGITDVVLLGMGGSSLAPEVLRAVVGVAAGAPRFTMLDSTDPGAVAAVSPRLKQTLFILASKSGTTIEPNSLAAHFHHALAEGVAAPAQHFVAITDPGTELAGRAARESFREAFINPPDIGGRYSALSLFGLVPAALMGQDVTAFLDWGASLLDACDPAKPVRDNPGAMLGLAMAAGALAGRDKLTLLVPPALEPFGLWVEQLVAESTGKQGVGVIPIAGELLPDTAGAYDDDRIFVHVRDAQSSAPDVDRIAGQLAAAGAPVLTIDLPEHAALGGEFLRWEIATAVAGALLGINPFDEPNVQTAKDATNALLGEFQKKGALPQPAPGEKLDGGATLTLSAAARKTDAAGFLNAIQHGDYLAVLAYLGPDPSFLQSIAGFRTTVRSRTRRATMFGYGPRYLHSTGQLHKGGPNSGVFVLVTATPAQDLPVPGQPFSFGTLELAQALGDFASLDRTGRRALHIHLPKPDARLLQSAFDVLLKSLKSSG